MGVSHELPGILRYRGWRVCGLAFGKGKPLELAAGYHQCCFILLSVFPGPTLSGYVPECFLLHHQHYRLVALGQSKKGGGGQEKRIEGELSPCQAIGDLLGHWHSR